MSIQRTHRTICYRSRFERNYRSIFHRHATTAGSKSDDLLKVSLDLIDQVACRAMYAPSKRLRQGLNDDQFCAGVLSGGQDTCQGDSGGPLQVVTPKNQCIFHIVGVTSFGRACAARNTAGVYTRVSAYLDWLEPIVWGGSRRE